MYIKYDKEAIGCVKNLILKISRLKYLEGGFSIGKCG